MNFNRETFFSGVRDFLKSQRMTLTQKRTDALEFLITAFEETKWTVPQISYAFATIFHETAHTFEPVTEYGPKSYFNKYNAGTRIGRTLGNTEEGDGYKFRGRGYVQITGRTNYAKFGLSLRPDTALNPPTAFLILHSGMEKGVFTGRKLSDYISDTGKDYKNARKIINGLDKAGMIAGYANQFESILRAAKLPAAASSTKPPQHIESPIKAGESLSDEQQPDFTEGKRPADSRPINVENVENVKVDNTPPPQTKPVQVTVERVSIWAKVGAGIAAITGIGINFGNLVTTRLNDMTLAQLGYVLGGVAILAVALFLYDRAARRAHEKTLAKMLTASDPAQNTVELREQTTEKR